MIQNQPKKNILPSSILLFLGIAQISLNVSILVMLFLDNNLTTFSRFKNLTYNNSLDDLHKCKSFHYGDYKYSYNRSYLTIVNLMIWLICLISIPCIIGIVILFKKYVTNENKYFVYETSKIKRSIFMIEGMILFLDGIVFGYLLSFYQEIKSMNCTSNLIIEYRKSFLKYFIVSATTILVGIVSIIILSTVENIIEKNQTEMKNIFQTTIKKSTKTSKIITVDRLDSERGLNHEDRINPNEKIAKSGSISGFQITPKPKDNKLNSNIQHQKNHQSKLIQPQKAKQKLEINAKQNLEGEQNSAKSQKSSKIEAAKIQTEVLVKINSKVQDRQSGLPETQKIEASKIKQQNLKNQLQIQNDQSELHVHSSLKSYKSKEQIKSNNEKIVLKTKLDSKIKDHINHIKNIQKYIVSEEKKSNSSSHKKNSSNIQLEMKKIKEEVQNNIHLQKKQKSQLKSDETFTKVVKDEEMEIIQMDQDN